MILELALSIPVMHFLKESMWSRGVSLSGSLPQGDRRSWSREDVAHHPSPCPEPLPWISLHHQRLCSWAEGEVVEKEHRQAVLGRTSQSLQ